MDAGGKATQEQLPRQRRLIQLYKPLLTIAWHLLEGFLIEFGQ
jgi:hypothetical protein